jgi:hypothetical protein
LQYRRSALSILYANSFSLMSQCFSKSRWNMTSFAEVKEGRY